MSGGGRLAALLGALSAAAILTVPTTAGAHGGAAYGETPPQQRQAHPTEQPRGASVGGSASDAHVGDEAGPEDSAGGVEVVRYTSSDPYARSLAVAQALVDADGGTSEWVVLASGESWADAATAGPLAASLAAPVVLVPPGGLQSPTARHDLVEFLRSTGVRRVVIVGSSDVLPNHEPSVLYGLGMLPRNIERVHGDDAIGASIAIAKRIGAPAELGEFGRTVIIASDQSVADAVAVGSLAAAGPFPLLLTAPDVLDPRLATYLAEHEIEHVVLVGGTTATAPEVQGALETAGTTVTRLAGRDRDDTARLAADLFRQHTADDPACADGPVRIGLVPARRPDRALTAGSLLARNCTPLRYTDSGPLPADLRNTLYLSRGLSPRARATVFGGETSIPDSTFSIDNPPVRFAAFNFRLSTDADALIGVLEVIDENGIRRSFPETEVVRREGWLIPADWWQHPWYFIDYRPVISWSPDGHRIAYWGADSGELNLLDLRDGELRRIAHVDPELNEFDSILEWSPDGSKLAFGAIVGEELTLSDPDLTAAETSEYTSELFLHDVESGQTERLTHDNVIDSVGPWSPDGARLVYQRTPASRTWVGSPRPAYQHLGVLDFTTGESHFLHPYVIYAVGPRETSALWSPDGESLTFVAIPEANPWERPSHAYLADPDGSRVHEYPTPRCEDCIPYPTGWFLPPRINVHGWSPSGDRIAYSAVFPSQKKWLIRDIAADAAIEVLREDSDPPAGPTEPYRFVGWTREGNALSFLYVECHGGEWPQIAEWRIVEVAADGAGPSEVLDLSEHARARHLGCNPTFMLGPDRQSLAVANQWAASNQEASFHSQSTSMTGQSTAFCDPNARHRTPHSVPQKTATSSGHPPESGLGATTRSGDSE